MSHGALICSAELQLGVIDGEEAHDAELELGATTHSRTGVKEPPRHRTDLIEELQGTCCSSAGHGP